LAHEDPSMTGVQAYTVCDVSGAGCPFVSSFNLLSLSLYKWLIPYLLLKNFSGQN